MTTNAQIVDALRKARKLIASKHEWYTCHALDTLRRDAQIDAWTCNSLTQRIEQRLAPHDSLEGWLAAQLGVKYPQVLRWMKRNRGRIRAHRLAWIDQLIKEHS